MKRILLISFILLLVISFSVNIMAEEAVNTKLNSSDKKLRANGGFSFGFINLDLAVINEMIEKEGFNKLDNNLVLTGGGGIGGNKKGKRYGGLGAGGSIKSINNEKKAIFNLGFGGFVYEKGIYAKNDTDLAIGGLIGGGRMSLTLIYQDPATFAETIEGGDTNNTPYSITLEKGFLVIEPRINLHYQFHERFGLQLTVGYLLTHDFGDEWQVGDKTVKDGPSGILNSPHVSVQLSYGF